MPPRHILALLPCRHKCSCLSSALWLRPLLIALSVGLCQIMEYNEVVAHHVCFFSALFSWNAISWHDPQQPSRPPSSTLHAFLPPECLAAALCLLSCSPWLCSLQLRHARPRGDPSCWILEYSEVGTRYACVFLLRFLGIQQSLRRPRSLSSGAVVHETLK